MFWGLVLEPNKKYTQKVDQTFHISQAALDLSSCSSNLTPIQLVVEYENSSFLLATLSKSANIFQVPLDLIFKTGDQVSFRTIGNGKVHLSGYHVLEDLDSMVLNGEEESELEELEEVADEKGKRKKSSPNAKGNKKVKLDETNEDESEGEEEEDDDDSDEDEDDEESIMLQGKGGKKKGKAQISRSSVDGDDDDDDEDDDDLEDDDDDDEMDEEEDEDDDDIEMEDDDELDELDLDDSEDENMKTPKFEKRNAQTPNGVLSKGKDKSNQKLNKSKKDAKQGTPGKSPETKSGKGEKHNKSGEVDTSPTKKSNENLKNGEKTPKSPKPEGTPQKKVLEGGVVSEEIKVGNGPVAKPGKMVTVYYVGTLASNKKQFDSVQNGPGFKFRVGRNEVIKGWDIGINGMKVGGKRKLTIPPHLAYGSKGSPPVIPPNSTLVFTVELRGLS